MPFGKIFVDEIENSGGSAVDLSSITTDDATTSASGYMSAADKTKLDGIDARVIASSLQNTVNAASTIKISQESANLSQVRAYGEDASTTGSLEFKVGPSTGAPLTPLTLTSAGDAEFSNKVTAEDFDSNHPSDSRFGRLNWAGARWTDTSGNNVIQFDADAGGNATFAGNVAASNLNCSGSVDVGNPSTNAYKQGFLAVPTPSSGGSYFQVYGKNGDVNKAFSVYNGDLAILTASIDSTGAASFAGPATVVNASTPTAYTRLYDGHMLISNTTAFGQAFGLYNTTTSAYEIAMFMDGSATFAGGSFVIDGDGEITTNIRGQGHLELDSTGAFTSPKVKLFSNTGAATFAGTVSAQGSVLTSDAKFKTDVTDANSQLDDVVALGNSLRNWTWTEEAPVNDKETRFLGLIAQEAEQVCPGVVAEIGEGESSYKGIKDDVILMKLLGAVAELKADNDALRAEVEALKIEIHG